MTTFIFLITPALATVTIVAVFGLGATIINFLLTKTTTGKRIMQSTPWMGWAETEAAEKSQNFRIHPSNYLKVTTR